MINIAELKIGQRVHYIPFKDCDSSEYENGVVKEIPEHTNTSVRVVYKCSGDWDNFKNYTSALTSIDQLRLGWHHEEVKVPHCMECHDEGSLYDLEGFLVGPCPCHSKP